MHQEQEGSAHVGTSQFMPPPFMIAHGRLPSFVGMHAKGARKGSCQTAPYLDCGLVTLPSSVIVVCSVYAHSLPSSGIVVCVCVLLLSLLLVL